MATTDFITKKTAHSRVGATASTSNDFVTKSYLTGTLGSYIDSSKITTTNDNYFVKDGEVVKKSTDPKVTSCSHSASGNAYTITFTGENLDKLSSPYCIAGVAFSGGSTGNGTYTYTISKSMTKTATTLVLSGNIVSPILSSLSNGTYTIRSGQCKLYDGDGTEIYTKSHSGESAGTITVSKNTSATTYTYKITINTTKSVQVGVWGDSVMGSCGTSVTKTITCTSQTKENSLNYGIGTSVNIWTTLGTVAITWSGTTGTGTISY